MSGCSERVLFGYRQHLLLQLDRFGLTAGVEIGTRHVAHHQECVGVFGPVDLSAKRQHLLPQLERVGSAASVEIGIRQVAHRHEPVGVSKTVHLSAERQHLLPQLERVGSATGVEIETRQLAHISQRFGVLQSQGPQVIITGPFPEEEWPEVPVRGRSRWKRVSLAVWPGGQAGSPNRSPASLSPGPVRPPP